MCAGAATETCLNVDTNRIDILNFDPVLLRIRRTVAKEDRVLDLDWEHECRKLIERVVGTAAVRYCHSEERCLNSYSSPLVTGENVLFDRETILGFRHANDLSAWRSSEEWRQWQRACPNSGELCVKLVENFSNDQLLSRLSLDRPVSDIPIESNMAEQDGEKVRPPKWKTFLHIMPSLYPLILLNTFLITPGLRESLPFFASLPMSCQIVLQTAWTVCIMVWITVPVVAFVLGRAGLFSEDRCLISRAISLEVLYFIAIIVPTVVFHVEPIW